MLLEDLTCIEDQIYGLKNDNPSISAIFDEQQEFEKKLIKEFYTALDRNVELCKINAYQSAEERMPLLSRISKILNNQVDEC